MNLKKHISINEFKLLLVIGFLASSFAFLSFSYEVINDYNNSFAEKLVTIPAKTDNKTGLELSIYAVPRQSFMPLFCFSTLFIIVALLKTKKFISSTILTAFSFLFFTKEQFDSWIRLLQDGQLSSHSFIELIFRIANAFNYLAFISVSILLFWQISIHFRSRKVSSQNGFMLR